MSVWFLYYFRILYTENLLSLARPRYPCPMLKPLRAAPDLVDTVYTYLRDAIVAGKLIPGARLAQEDLAERLGVSRQPVLQALTLLERDGLAVRADGRGTLQAAPLDVATVQAFYQLRSEIDALAARLAAKRVAAGVCAPLPEALCTRGRAAIAQNSINALIAADTHLHHSIYRASGNPLLESVMRAPWRHLERVMGAVLKHAPLRTGLWDEHQAIVAAINRGQPEEAARHAREHAERAADSLVPQLTEVLQAA